MCSTSHLPVSVFVATTLNLPLVVARLWAVGCGPWAVGGHALGCHCGCGCTCGCGCAVLGWLVRDLYLSMCDLSGTLPSTLSGLQSLTWVQVSFGLIVEHGDMLLLPSNWPNVGCLRCCFVCSAALPSNRTRLQAGYPTRCLPCHTWCTLLPCTHLSPPLLHCCPQPTLTLCVQR